MTFPSSSSAISRRYHSSSSANIGSATADNENNLDQEEKLVAPDSKLASYLKWIGGKILTPTFLVPLTLSVISTIFIGQPSYWEVSSFLTGISIGFVLMYQSAPDGMTRIMKALKEKDEEDKEASSVARHMSDDNNAATDREINDQDRNSSEKAERSGRNPVTDRNEPEDENHGSLRFQSNMNTDAQDKKGQRIKFQCQQAKSDTELPASAQANDPFDDDSDGMDNYIFERHYQMNQ